MPAITGIDRKLSVTNDAVAAAASKLFLGNPPPPSFQTLRSPQSSINSGSTAPSDLVLPARIPSAAAAGAVMDSSVIAARSSTSSTRKRKPLIGDDLVS